MHTVTAVPLSLDSLFGLYTTATGTAKADLGEALAQRLLHDASKIVAAATWQKTEQNEATAVAAAEKAFFGSAGFRGQCRFSSWFYKIVTNEVNDLRRAKKRDKAHHVSFSDFQPSGSLSDENEWDLDSAVHAAMDVNLRGTLPGTKGLNDRVLVRQILDTLRPQDRELLELVAEGYTYPEIGRRLNITESAAIARFRRVSTQIKRRFANPYSGRSGSAYVN